MGGCISKKSEKDAAPGPGSSADSHGVPKQDPTTPNPKTPGSTTADAHPPKESDQDLSVSTPPTVAKDQPVAPSNGEPIVRDFAEQRSSLDIAPAPPLGSKAFNGYDP